MPVTAPTYFIVVMRTESRTMLPAFLPPPVQPQDLNDLIRSLNMFAPVLQVLPSTVFFVKNTQAQYVYANDTLLHRLQLPDMAALIGKTSEDLFQSEWGQHYTQQDREVLSEGKTISNKLELHTYASGGLGWCITHKMPVRNPQGDIIAMLGVSVDVETNDSNRPELNKNQNAVFQRLDVNVCHECAPCVENIVNVSVASAGTAVVAGEQLWVTTSLALYPREC